MVSSTKKRLRSLAHATSFGVLALFAEERRMIMKKVKTLILGGGISGLALAYLLGEEYLIVEKENCVGGLCRTFHDSGFVWDFAGHFFHFKDEAIKQFFDKKIQKSQVVECKKDTRIYWGDRYIDFPFQKNIHQLHKEEFINCLYDLFNRNQKAEYLDFQDMLYGKFGNSITEYFLKPYNEKLYACPLTNLDKDAMGRFFPYADPQEIINNFKICSNDSYNETFEYPKGGAEVFVNVLLEELKRENILTNTKINRIDIKKHIAYCDTDEIHYEVLVNTIPLNQFAMLLSNSMLDSTKCLHANKVLVYNIGFDSPPEDKSVNWIYYPQRDVNFYRVGFYNNILCMDNMSIYVEIGLKSDDYIDLKKEYDQTIKNLKKVGIIQKQSVVAYNTLMIDPGYVHITPESCRYVDKMRGTLSKDDVYFVGRYGSWTYCSIEDCMLDATKIYEKLTGKKGTWN